MNTLHLSTLGATIGSAGMLAASILPGAVGSTAKTVSNAEKNQSTITNYMDNQGNGNYVKHNRTSMDNAWNYFNPLKYQQGASASSSATGSSTPAPTTTATGSGVNPGGPDMSGTGTNLSTTPGTADTSTSGSTTTTGTTPGSSSVTSTDTTGSPKTPQIPSPLRHVVVGDVTNALHKIKKHWRSSDSNPSWTPTGTSWQADWSNWNPTLWEQNGSTYANWAKQLGTYLSTRFPSYASELKQVGL